MRWLVTRPTNVFLIVFGHLNTSGFRCHTSAIFTGFIEYWEKCRIFPAAFFLFGGSFTFWLRKHHLFNIYTMETVAKICLMPLV